MQSILDDLDKIPEEYREAIIQCAPLIENNKMNLAERMRENYRAKEEAEKAKKEAEKRAREAELESLADAYIEQCKVEAEQAVENSQSAFTMPTYLQSKSGESYHFSCGSYSHLAFKEKVHQWAVSEGLACNILLDDEYIPGREHKVRFWC